MDNENQRIDSVQLCRYSRIEYSQTCTLKWRMKLSLEVNFERELKPNPE